MTKKLFYSTAAVLGAALIMPTFVFAQESTGTVNANVEVSPIRARVNATTTAGVKANANADARLQRAKEKARQEIDRRTKALNIMQERISNMRRVSDSFKNDLRTAVTTEVEKINALRIRIEAGMSGDEIRTDVQSITKSYRVFALVMPKAHIAAAADKVVAITAMMSEIGAKLQARIQAAGSSGADIAALSAALADLSAKITSANAHAQAAVNGTATLTPDEGDKAKMEANTAALKTARAELQAAQQDIVAGRKDIRTIIDGLREIQGGAGVNVSTTTQL